MSQVELARRLGKTPAAINEIIKGRRGITADMAWRLAREFGTTPDFWLNGQMNWDLYHAKQALLRKRR